MSTFKDVRIAFRLLSRNPVPTGVALVSIALGVGATRDVFSLIFRQGFLTVSIGLALGLGAALAAARSLRSVLPGLQSGHSVSVWIAAGLVTGTAALACWLPARRATRTNPVLALRHE